jgi:hypothetical protein
MIRAGLYVELDRHAGAAQSIRIGLDSLRERDRDHRPKCRLEANHVHLLRARQPHKAIHRPSPAPAEQRMPAEIVVLLRPDKFADEHSPPSLLLY